MGLEAENVLTVLVPFLLDFLIRDRIGSLALVLESLVNEKALSE